MSQPHEVASLLSQVKTISDSYRRLEKFTGEKFNIFSVLKIETDEVRTHSRFLAELLNPEGSHKYGDDFLKLFIKEMKLDTSIDTASSKAFVEYYCGPVTTTTGGNLDILIRDKEGNCIMIENKIYASEQPNQLIRYSNFNPEGMLIFLTLRGEESKNSASKDIRYKILSYELDVINWLEKCKSVAVDSPMLREILTHYINLLKKLTHQNTNSQMNDDLTSLILDNKNYFDSYSSLLAIEKDLKRRILSKTVVPILKEVGEVHGVDLILPNEDEFINITGSWLGFSYKNTLLESYGLSIVFQANQSAGDGLNRMHFGLVRAPGYTLNDNDSNISNKFRELFGTARSSNIWLAYAPFTDFFMLGDINTLSEIHFDALKFKEAVSSTILKVLDILDPAKSGK